MMVGRPHLGPVPEGGQRGGWRSGARGPRISRAPAKGDTSSTSIQDISFAIRSGEIVGLAGLVGSGRTELARSIFGADRIDSGQILVDGKPVALKHPLDAIELGIGLVPEDRKRRPSCSDCRSARMSALPTLAL